jgi:hypothetical protein
MDNIFNQASYESQVADLAGKGADIFSTLVDAQGNPIVVPPAKP